MGLFSLGEQVAGREPPKLDDDRSPVQAATDTLTTTGLLPVPVSPLEKMIEEQGKAKVFGKMLLGGMTGMQPLLMPEMFSGRAMYKAEVEDYWKQVEEQREIAARKGYADVLANPDASATDRAVGAVMAGGVGEYDPNSRTLSAGQVSVDGAGNVIAKGGPQLPPAPTAPMQNANTTAQGYGIPMGSRAHADLIAAYAEPSGSRVMEDGAIVPFNTVDKVLADWRAGVYNQQQQGQQQGQGSQRGNSDLGVTAGGGVTTAGAADATTRNVVNAETAENTKLAPTKIEFYNDLEGVLQNFGEWDASANNGEGGFIVNEATLDNYGSVQNHLLYPGRYELFKGAKEKDSLAYMEQLVDMLTVDERGKLKGQGQITEGETDMLKRASTVLQNRNLSDTAVQREISKLMRQIYKRRQKFADLVPDYGSGKSEVIEINLD